MFKRYINEFSLVCVGGKGGFFYVKLCNYSYGVRPGEKILCVYNTMVFLRDKLKIKILNDFFSFLLLMKKRLVLKIKSVGFGKSLIV